MTNLITALGHALWMAFAMFWEILWPLILRLRFVRSSAGGCLEIGDEPAVAG